MPTVRITPDMVPGDILLIRWHDPLSGTPYWKELGVARAHRPAECLSVGFMVATTPEHLTIAQSSAEDHAGGIFAIPWGCIETVDLVYRGA